MQSYGGEQRFRGNCVTLQPSPARAVPGEGCDAVSEVVLEREGNKGQAGTCCGPLTQPTQPRPVGPRLGSALVCRAMGRAMGRGLQGLMVQCSSAPGISVPTLLRARSYEQDRLCSVCPLCLDQGRSSLMAWRGGLRYSRSASRSGVGCAARFQC